VGRDRVGGRISPQNIQNDIDDSDPQALFSHVVKSLDNRGAYLHIIEGDTSGNPVPVV
jgi:N-ethylmaleimide reductase